MAGKEEEKKEQPVKYLKKLSDKDPIVRANAAIALGDLGDKSAVPALEVLEKDKDPKVQIAAAYARVKLGDNRAFPVLMDVLTEEKDKNSDVYHLAVCALVTLKYKDIFPFGPPILTKPLPTVDIAIEALKDKDPNVRRLAALALGELKNKKAITPLLDALKVEKDKEIKEKITDALNKILKLKWTTEQYLKAEAIPGGKPKVAVA